VTRHYPTITWLLTYPYAKRPPRGRLRSNLDAVFDGGFITVGDAGEILVSDLLGKEARGLLGLHHDMKLRGVTDEHRRYILWHRSRVFRQIGS